MSTLTFDTNKTFGAFKILNATNAGPWGRATSNHSNFNDYKLAKIPYSRNHDSALHECYGGPYSHDISNIFPCFDADVNDPNSYDFACTDEDILITLEAGTKTFFRLGQTIEHQVKKHHTLPPKDFKKWAQICEHVIMHYTEGWANGFHYDMPYWEIWNEPDLSPEEGANKPTWGGKRAEFFEFFTTAASHLKARFPHLKIGGPALAFNEEWADEFLQYIRKRNVEIDFFSWHFYSNKPEDLVGKAQRIRKIMDKHGYEKAESHVNEWNYIKGWSDEFIYSAKAIHGCKGASFLTACICEAQKTDIDMLMYYDTRPSVYNGLFDFISCERLKGYYPMSWYSSFYDMVAEVRETAPVENIHCICGVDKKGKTLTMLTYFSDDDDAPNKEITLDLGKGKRFEVYLVDQTHDGEKVATTDSVQLDLSVHSCVLIKEI